MRIILFLVLMLAPVGLAFAQQTVTKPTDLKSLLGNLTGIINILIPLIFGLTFLTIGWGVARAWIMGEATENDVERGKKIALVGVIVLAIMSAIWGILALIKSGIFG